MCMEWSSYLIDVQCAVVVGGCCGENDDVFLKDGCQNQNPSMCPYPCRVGALYPCILIKMT